MHRIITMLITEIIAVLPAMAGSAGITVTAVNRLGAARTHQTIELAAAVFEPLGEKDLSRIHIKDSNGKEMLCQSVDTDGDHTPDRVIFQTDFVADETKMFTAFIGNKWTYTREQFKAYGRFARERFDDFAWENDRIAHRMYGKALETWVGEPLTSSTVDVWSKRVARMVINDWYMADNYHADAGEGADFYSAGTSRGCGGNGLWAGEKLWVSKNFVGTRVFANGPIRVMFELTYEPFDVNGLRVAEIKRITLDAGQNLDHFQSFYRSEGAAGQLTTGIGLKKVAGEAKEFNAELGLLVKWEPMVKNAGSQGLAVLVDPATIEKQAEDRLNHLVVSRAGADNTAQYWAGFCWDKAGQFSNFGDWKAYAVRFARGLRSPIEIAAR